MARRCGRVLAVRCGIVAAKLRSGYKLAQLPACARMTSLGRARALTPGLAAERGIAALTR